EAANAGIKISDQTWKEIREFYTRNQLQDGGWPYHNSGGLGVFGDERITMTCAGACGLLIANKQLNDKDGTAKQPISNALERIAERFTINYPTWKFYNLYGLSRAGRLSGQKEFATKNRKIDWYREGSTHLLATQFPEGCWRGDSVDGNPVVATS